MSVATQQRFTRNRPCPICGGYETLPRGHKERCWGFLSDDGGWAHCVREEQSGGLPRNTASDTYAHRLDGDCDCGAQHDPRPASATGRDGVQPLGDIITGSDFLDEQGRLLYEEVRFEPKTFRLRRPDGNGGWTWKLGSVRRVLYNLPALVEADPNETVYIPEGPKDAKRLIDEHLLATTNALGAKKWLHSYSDQLQGRHVVLLADNDEDGREHVKLVARSLLTKAASIKILEFQGLRDGGDVSDWLDASHTIEELKQLAEDAPLWEPSFPGEDAERETEQPSLIQFEAQTVGDFLAEEIPALDAIISDGGQGAILSSGEKLMLAGPPGVGKTNIGLNFGTGLSSGSGFLGLPCGLRWNVLYVALEGNRKRLQKRFRKRLRDADAETLSRLHFVRLPALDLSNDAHVQALEELCRRHSIDVLFLDPLRDAHPWGEDKSEDAARLTRVLDRILAALPNLAIVLIHHVRKPDPRRLTRAEQTLDQIRGSGHLVAACQSVLLVNEDPNEPDKLLADWVKHRDAEERMAPMFLYFDRDTLSYEVTDRPGTVKVSPEAIVNAIISAGGYHEGPSLVHGLMEGAGASERTVRDAIRQARDLSLITEEKVPGSGNKRAYRVELEEVESR